MKTRFEIIETPDYILAVSDEEIKENDVYLDDTSTLRKSITSNKEYWKSRNGYKKIIAYQPKGNAPELDLPLLPEWVEDDVEKKTNRKVCKCKRAYENPLSEICSLCWNELYPDEKDEVKEEDLIEVKAATKKYSEDDLRKCFYDAKTPSYEDFGDYVQYIKQSKTPKWFVAEMENPYTDGFTENRVRRFYGKPVLKTTTINGKTYLVGTYE